ncbi:MAG: NAD(P)-binding domain-containing protein [Clostridia bacterium]|nr:NAD(P)-binding domain-containing protein [Clostridia bacterium]
MKLIAFGGDERMQGALAAARHAGHETAQITSREQEMGGADAVLLPWPQSFAGDALYGGSMSREEALARIPPCRAVLAGAGVRDEELPQCARVVRPGEDEIFLLRNAVLTAEGAIFSAMQRMEGPIAGSCALITGFGRIGRALAQRLAAMEAFVIVCARNEDQMRAAHAMGAHPVPLAEIASACAQADFVMNTVPAHVLGAQALARLAGRAKVFELASPPYGMDVSCAVRMGVELVMESGVPGRYAPGAAGEALYDALMRGMDSRSAGDAEGGKADG